MNRGLFHTGCGGGADGKGEKVIFGLTTSIQSIGEGNYGRLAPGQQQRYTHALAETMFAEPATGGTPDEQPGAMPEIFPSPDQGANIDRCWTCRSMFMQAWGNYGTAWPVVHQWLGVRPDLGRSRLELRAAGAGRSRGHRRARYSAGERQRGWRARRIGDTYRTEVDVHRLAAAKITIGHTLPRDARVAEVRLNKRTVGAYQTRVTNRGLEVTVPTRVGSTRW